MEALCQRLGDRGVSCSVFSGSEERYPRIRLLSSAHRGTPVYRVVRSDRFANEWFASDSAGVEAVYQELLEELRPDLVHVHHWMRLCRSLVRTASALAIPTVVTLHDLWTTCRRGDRLLGAEICEAALRSCGDCHAGLPHQTEAEVRREARFFRRDVRAELAAAGSILVPSFALADRVRMGLDLDEKIEKVSLPPLLESRTNSREEKPVVSGARGDEVEVLKLVFWGHLDPGKGPHLLVEAAARAADEGLAVTVDLYGDSLDPSYRDQLRGLGASTDSGRLELGFHGAFDRTRIDPERFDIAVFPSLFYESHSFVVDEAWAWGLPVLVPDRGSFPERLGDDGVGLMFRAGSVSDLASKLIELGRDRERRVELRRRVRPSRRTWEEHLGVLLEVYGGVAGRGAGRSDTVRTPVRRREEGLGEGDLARREEEIERLLDRGRASGGLRVELTAHRKVLLDLEQELGDQCRSLGDLRADAESHRRVLDEQEAELRRHREVVDSRRVALSEHREVLADREMQISQHREVVEERRRLAEQAEKVREGLEQDLEGHRRLHGELRQQAKEKARVIASRREEVRAHRELMEALMVEICELTRAAQALYQRHLERPGREEVEGGLSGPLGRRDVESALAELDRVLRGLLKLQDAAS